MTHSTRIAAWIWLSCIAAVVGIVFSPVVAIAQEEPSDNPDATQLLIEADRLFLQGDIEEAEQLYRRAKPPFASEGSSGNSAPFTDPQQLSPAGGVYWRQAQQGLEQGLEIKTLQGFQLLLDSDPNFVPAYPLYVEALETFGRSPADQIAVLERAASSFPESEQTYEALIAAYQEDDRYLEASIVARQFALVNSDHPRSAVYLDTAQEDFERFRGQLNTQILTQGALGTVGAVVRENYSSALQVLPLLVQGESKFGAYLAEATVRGSETIDDPVISDYIDTIGQALASQMGRNDFEYEFYLVEEESLNAFALPGGKIFIHTGSLLAMDSEAELAGLLSHEIAHAVLSHSYLRLTTGVLVGNFRSVVPSQLLGVGMLSYSRSQEQQSDTIGTRTLAASGYAADGLRNFFADLLEEEKGRPPEYLSTHPATENRIADLEELIARNGYNRYTYEGVENLRVIQQRLRKILNGEPVPTVPEVERPL